MRHPATAPRSRAAADERLLVPVPAPAESVVTPPAPLPPGIFRLHIESQVPVPLTEHLGIVDTHYGVAKITVTESTRLVCVSPCDTVIDARAGHELTLDPTEFPATWGFHLPGQGGNLTLFVKPGNEGGLTAGRWTTVLGAIAFSFGVIAVPLNYANGPAPLTGFNAASVGMLAGGAVVLAGGIVLLVTQHTRIRFASGTLSRTTAGAVSF